MKRIYYSLFVVFFVTSTSIAQTTCSGGQFQTQADVDAFGVQFSDCNSIEYLEIFLNADDMDPISNLDAFSNVEYVGFLSINDQGIYPNTYVSLQPFSNLTSVGDAVFTTVHDFTGLENLIEVEGGLIINFVNLEAEHISLVPFNNLASATTICLDIEDAGAYLTDVFPSLNVLQNLIIGEGAQSLESFNVAELSGFSAIQQLETFQIGSVMGQPNHIGSLDILNNVETISIFVIDWLTCNSFDGFQNLQTAGDMTFLIFNFSGGIIDFPMLETSGNMWFWINQEVDSYYSFPLLNSCGYMYLFQDLGANSFNLSMPSLNTINGFFEYSNYSSQINEVLEFPQLDSVTGDFTIQGTSWSDLDVFSNLLSIGGDVIIGANPQLSNCDIMALCEKVAVAPDQIELNSNADGCNSIAELAIACQVGGISGTVYLDLNCNGVVDFEDNAVMNPIILDSEGLPIGGSGSNGDYFIPFLPNTTFELAPQPVEAALATLPITIVTGDIEQVFGGNDFLMCPNFDFHDCSVSAFSNGPPRPGFDLVYNVIIRNNGYNTESATVTFDLSNMPGASFAEVGNGVINGNNVSYDIDAIAAQEEIILELLINTSASTPLSTFQNPLITLYVINDDVPANNTYTWSQTVVGSYDPNDITVNIEAQNFTELPSEGLALDYTIRFQNTGTASAEFVRVTDIIEEDLNLGSIQMLSSSHSFQLSFNENREVEWLFENIQLPDSTTDLEGSQGYIHYRIKTNADVTIDDVIENTAAIYFDYNEPVITNTATTIFYTCPVQIAATGTASVCEGESIEMIASTGWDNYEWMLGNEVVGDQSSISLGGLAAGIYNLSYSGSTQYCESMDMLELNIIDIPQAPTIIQNGNTLTASGSGVFTWSLNGVLLDEMTNTLNITESGNYSVILTSNGCESSLGEGNFTFIGVYELTSGEILVFPNPTADFITITIPDNLIGSSMVLIDMLGNEVMNNGKITSNKITLDCSTLATGIYELRIGNLNKVVVRQ